MGKKGKIGKSRKDKFYHLAKETGYRSRSAFKLIQLNRKFQFLQRARALVDLCAAPGGWLQVASKFMPVSSLIIGVDLVPIKPIPNVVTLQEDITSESCRQTVKKQLQTWKADVVLNDGAPNVGANWTHDAFSQVHLSLMALRLACDCLSKGGWFITKIFRSSDYQSLLWILQQFFKKVNSTKPQASRSESAEIFVVCQGYFAPDKIDNRFFDPKFAFKDVDGPLQTVSQLLSHKKPKAEGYAVTSLSLYHRASLMDFIRTENPVDFLSKTSEIALDDTELVNHQATTNDIRECCRDIKVLGRKELRSLLSWRSKLRRYLARKLKEESKESGKEIKLSSDEEDEVQSVSGKEHIQEDDEFDQKLAELKSEELSALKRKKTFIKAQRRQRERFELKMDLPGVSIADEGENWYLLQTLCEGDMSTTDILLSNTSVDEDLVLSNDEIEQEMMRYLLQGAFSSLDFNEDEDLEISQMQHLGTNIGGKKQQIIKQAIKNLKPVQPDTTVTSTVSIGDGGKTSENTAQIVNETSTNDYVEDMSDSESDSSEDERDIKSMKVNLGKRKDEEKEEADFEIVPVERPVKRSRVLGPDGLALGTVIASSKKCARDLIDASFNRYAFNDDEDQLPDWFVVEERKHKLVQLPVDRQMMEEYRKRQQELNARPIKKVAEAKARKKRRMLKKLEQVKKKAEAVVNTTDISEREKAAQLRGIYKKASLGKEKHHVTYLVAKKGVGRKVRRPAGVKGHFKVVDGRMKKDMKSQKRRK
ncbi:hypothetical protein GDO86_012980 [Hymenochirus boettgeri]|uniref:pre-rRNA processing protein FTSJ3 n=1 Tax=Hymenochirus boettgeri TaxID=247094 RepID=A0A8T2ISB3_9PIPI|nr:hypothetical protein GDO86_012980 [Hymenochirus boettgeri]